MPDISLVEIKGSTGDTLRGVLTAGAGRALLVLMLGGFERKATTEKKFTALSARLAARGTASFRYDNIGLGLSDGDFASTTVEQSAADLELIASALADRFGYAQFSVAAHSLAACAVDLVAVPLAFRKIILINPALNQRDLTRYYFALDNNPDQAIDWRNYITFLSEPDFKASLDRGRMTRENWAPVGLRKENADKAYGRHLPIDRTLLIQGENDNKVPTASLPLRFSNSIMVKGGDHDLERPDWLEEWLGPAIDFISN